MNRRWGIAGIALLLAGAFFVFAPSLKSESRPYDETRGGTVMKASKCGVCGFVSLEGAPEKCPVCGSPKKVFKDSEVKSVKDWSKAGELEKKHVPKITINKQCGMFPDGCTDVYVKVGEITHPMLPEHFILHIDFYVDKKFASRTYLTPEKVNPAACAHIKVPKGKLTVIENCNIHGDWMNEADL